MVVGFFKGAEANACSQRIQEFLQLSDSIMQKKKQSKFEEYDFVPVKSSSLEDIPLHIQTCSFGMRNCSFSYPSSEDIVSTSSRENALRDVSFQLEEGELMVVCGSIGSGKSSLLLSLLGELKRESGEMWIGENSGQIAFCSQSPWIFPGSVKDNIAVTNHNCSENDYLDAVRACALMGDIGEWEDGDATNIGEKGVNLSGGQKARISLARACVCHDASLCLLDDPLSAVDGKIRSQLFHEAIRGILRRKAVILVTHQLQYLKFADKVMVLGEDGSMEGFGKLKDVIESSTFLSSSSSLNFDEIEISFDEHQETKEEGINGNEVLNGGDEKQLFDKDEPLKKNEVLKKNENEIPKEIIEKEDRSVGSVSLDTYKKFVEHGGVWYCGLLSFLIILAQFIIVLGDYWLKVMVDDSFGLSPSIYIAIFGGIALFCVIVSQLRAIHFFKFCLKSTSNIHAIAVSRMFHTPMSFFSSNPSGRILNKFAKDQNLADELLPTVLFNFVDSFSIVIAAIIIIMIALPYLAVILIPLGYLFIIVRKKYLTSSREVKRLEAISRSPLFTTFGNSLNGLHSIRAYKLQHEVQSYFLNLLDRNGKGFISFLLVSRWVGFRFDIQSFLLLVGGVLAAYFLKDYNVVDQGLTSLSLVYVLSLSGLAQWCVRQSAEVENQMVSLERIINYTELDQEEGYSNPTHDEITVDNNNKIERSEDELLEMVEVGENNHQDKPWPSNGNLSILSLSVGYEVGGTTILKEIDLHIPSGCKVGIIGKTGCGKSTLISSFLQLNVVHGGDIQLDGQSLLSMNLKQARDCFSYLPQDPVLFSGSIKYNLDPFNRYSEKEVWEALDDAQLGSFIRSLPDSIHSEVSLSAGQKQLMSLARAILKRSKIVLMDEPSSNVDFTTDSLLQERIRHSPALADSIVVMIAHRIQTISDSDLIVVISGGEVVEQDSPEELLKDKHSEYSSFMRSSREASIFQPSDTLVSVNNRKEEEKEATL